MSAESGISTFRDSGGLWEKYAIEDVATPEAWRKNPDLVSDFYNQRRKQIIETEPNKAHRIIAELEKKYDVRVITQNIDDLHETLELEAAGAFAIVLELVPAELAARITAALKIPTIGIGAGVNCDAQVLVWTDLMGMGKSAPKLAKAYRNLRVEMLAATDEWAKDVINGVFPGPEQTFN